MAELPELERALFTWVNDVINRLARDPSARDYTTDLGHWQRDPDGAFRDSERPIEFWSGAAMSSQFDLPTWTAVLDVLRSE